MSKIISNHHRYPIIWGFELSEKERAKFDYRSPDDLDATQFVRYRNELYDLCDMERSTVKGWDMMHADSYFSAVLIRYAREEWGTIDTDHVICALYLC